MLVHSTMSKLFFYVVATEKGSKNQFDISTLAGRKPFLSHGEADFHMISKV